MKEKKEREDFVLLERVKRGNDLLKEIERIYYRTTTFPQIKNIVAANSHLFKCGSRGGGRESIYIISPLLFIAL